MNLYVSTESDRKLRNVFSNLSGFYIINVDMLVEASRLDLSKNSHRFLMNSEIERLISIGAKSKRYSGIVYINSMLDKDTVQSLKESVDNLKESNIDYMVLLDDYELPKLKKLYKLFDEVTFFSSLKKTKIIQCTPLKKQEQTEDEDNK
jgi:hypothetical protein